VAASAALWSAADSIATLLSTELNALAAGSVGVSSGVALDNTTATSARRQYGMLELNVTFGSAPAAGDSVAVYAVPYTDGTNPDDVTDPINPALLIAVIPVRATTGAQKIAAPCVIPGPFKFKIALKNNNASQAFPATSSTLKLTTFDSEQQ
jgi:hypothetical protein